jgi:hypothetical protein
MSAPGLDNKARGALEYAPKWARRGEAGVRAAADAPKAAPPARLPAAPSSRSRHDSPPLEGGVAIMAAAELGSADAPQRLE